MNESVYPLTLYYESACPLCDAEMRNLQLRNTAGLLRFVDISSPGFKDFPPGTDLAALLALIHARRADGQVIRGVEVFRLAYSAVGLPWVARLSNLPLLRGFSEAAYALLARHRHRLPRGLVRLVFETGLRRAAERSARQANCSRSGQCTYNAGK
jgi:predicted DCC family thiol-disulfide oxidoreductase YuxK